MGIFKFSKVRYEGQISSKRFIFFAKHLILCHNKRICSKMEDFLCIPPPSWTWLNIVKHIQGSQFGPLGPQKSVTKELQKCPKTAIFCSKMAIFGCFWHPPVALSRGLNGFNISPWMCSIMFKQLWALFSFFWRIGGNQSKIRCFGRFGGLQGPPRDPKRGPRHQKRWAHQSTTITKTVKIICKVWLMKNKICPTSTT